MVGPIDYTMNVLTPMQRFTEGLKFGEDLLTARQGRQETEQMMGLRDAAEARAAQEFEMRRADAERQRAQAEAGQAALMELVNLGTNATVDDYTRAYIANPAIRQDLSSLKTMLEAPKLETMLTTSRDLYAASKTGNIDAVRNQLALQRDAAKNSGNQNAAQAAQIQLDQLDANPDAAMNVIAASSGLMVFDLKGPDYFKQINEVLGVGEATAEGASPLGKIAQDVESGLIPKSVLDTAIRVDEKASEEGLTLQQQIAEEARLRGEYAKRTEDLSAAERNFSIIEMSAADDSGAGDIALVTSFMKMLDPGSVVRETEFATAANAGGLLARLSAIAKKVETGQFLDAKQRADFKRLAGEYLNAAKTQEQGVQQSFNLIVENYGLDPVNVFGARAATAAPTPDAISAAGDDAKATFMANPNVSALAPEVREMAWEIYQKQMGQ